MILYVHRIGGTHVHTVGGTYMSIELVVHYIHLQRCPVFIGVVLTYVHTVSVTVCPYNECYRLSI